ncbi:MAG: aminotransferase class I/II-fold pyridoxal phosphate-dependent enzyme [Calditrichaeota bacterium]|nr:MAG: aminotransferase class I/II-fold pyridoxal phosphate-dependent enzyme [Calditrichota bacterium]
MPETSSHKTLCVHSGTIEDPVTHGSITPIYPGTSYAYLDLEKKAYPRYFNTPNQEALAQKISALEHGEAGLIFSSGMAAISTTLLSFLHKGDHAIIQNKLYGGTSNFIANCFDDFGISHTTTAGLAIDDFDACLQANTRLIYIETPSNPLLQITDIAAVAELAKTHGLISVIDNTFASPINQNPLDLGIDVVVHSATKYLSGHSDICAGAAVSSTELMQRILGRAKNFGGSLNAQTCSLLERSIKTLALRVEQQNRNAQEIAEYLNSCAHVDKVYYPGLVNHEGHDLAKIQMRGFGGMLSFELADALDTTVYQKALKLIKPSMSLGGVETTICSAAMTSHAVLSPEEREAEGIKDSLLRLSVGIEDADDLIADLQNTFAKI